MPSELQSRPVLCNGRQYPGIQVPEPQKIRTHAQKPMAPRVLRVCVNTMLKEFEAQFTKEKE